MTHAFTEINAAFPWFFAAVVFVFGACIGSFLNVVIYRLPKHESIVSPGSHCACGAPIAWYDNIPILSWLILRGRARCCGRPYAFRYAFVELLTAALFLACWVLFPPAKALCGMVFVGLLLPATFIDLDHLEIPDVFSLGGGVIGVVLSFAVPALHGHHGDFFLLDSFRSGVDALVGLLAGSGLVLWIALLAEAALKKEAMGFGDVKFIGAIGAFTGWQGAVFAIFGGAVIGTVWLALALIWQKLTGRAATVAPRAETPEGEPAALGLGVHIPFGPMLALGGLAHFLFFHDWVAAYFAPLRGLL
ncbi:prepilin peptidase [Horticoccus luteus]|uniref:Prepilin peptidase n=1 Tax=Horticoccus luteus TaxID=2862869 RepID=A0A8F9XK60_9BACT|nr:A24 family peptidase [Horticoccus luteus]QYM79373.1 prepilin peptidase [Horticoccus luteus]